MEGRCSSRRLCPRRVPDSALSRTPALSVRKLWIAVESTGQLVGVEARRHFKRPAKPDGGRRPSSPWPVERRAFVRFCALSDADHAPHDQLKSFFAPGEVKARPLARAVGQEVPGKDDASHLDADGVKGVTVRIMFERSHLRASFCDWWSGGIERRLRRVLPSALVFQAFGASLRCRRRRSGPSTRAEARQDILVFLGHMERVF
jgi:hypothetical protein